MFNVIGHCPLPIAKNCTCLHRLLWLLPTLVCLAFDDYMPRVISLLCWCTAASAFVRPLATKRSPSFVRPATIEETLEAAAPAADQEPNSLNATLHDADIFSLVAGRTAVCLFESDIRRDAIGAAAGIQASSATNWINDASAFGLQQTMNRLKWVRPDERTGVHRDEAAAWTKWLQSIPTPTLVDLSADLRAQVNRTLTDKALDMIDQTRDLFLARLICRLVLLPSGAALTDPLTEPPASVIYGRILYGGVSRSRLLVSSNSRSQPRRAGVRSVFKTTANEYPSTWMMYGGPSRLYEAADMGPAAVLEVGLLPRGKVLDTVDRNMRISGVDWSPKDMFDFITDDEKDARPMDESSTAGYTPASLSGNERNEAFRTEFRSSVGGLQKQIDAIVRRVLDGRVIRPDTTDADEGDAPLTTAALEAEELALLGLNPVRGLLLYGPPGCGKTALAREISRSLKARAPKIVSAPELLDRWVGGSEKLVRSLFADAEAELAVCNGDATKSALHVVVIDEIDAVFRKRSSAEDSGEATRSSVVNQILAKLDGVSAIPNVLLIGMTNRRELLDEALLRPGRLEVQIEVPLPDKEGRREILQIHFDALRQKDRLSRPLCCAIDGVPYKYDGSQQYEESEESTPGRKRRAVQRAFRKVVGSWNRRGYDLAASTDGFSGADLAGLVRCAGSLALARARQDGSGVDGLLITLQDVKEALNEVQK